MTYEEAIKELKECREFAEKRGSYYGEKAIPTYDLAIEAIEKQIPKKPTDCDGYYCPNCGARVDDDGRGYEQPYCMECSQAIDWSE